MSWHAYHCEAHFGAPCTCRPTVPTAAKIGRETYIYKQDEVWVLRPLAKEIPYNMHLERTKEPR
jgi:hypothetical protein